ncbi:PIR protein [Plasmodium ovale]|uniref:PIR Superfamily Protein n=2 Tax=Plasmodium ovale TaxID=36330 RepID=A0A1A8WDR5_PLAOA|nr:PIR Superfamily Protein [Plasmodium ovale curtisi]SBT84864.1 PIR protein [Plasmodium ovale]
MVHVIYYGTDNGGVSRSDECFDILSTIQSTSQNKIAELNKTRESEGNFLEKCKDLDEYLKNYNKDNTDCYEGEFTYIYDSVKYTINEELSKSTNYSKCIEKLKPKKQGQVDPEDATSKSDKEKQDSEVPLPEGRSQSILSSDRASEETERSRKHELPDKEQTKDQELDAANQQITLEPSENGTSLHSSGVPNAEASQNQVDAHGNSGAKDTVASGESTAVNSASNELGDHQRTSSQDGALATANPKEAPGAQGLDNGELSSSGLAEPDEPASKDVLTVPDGSPPDSQGSSPLHRSCLRASTQTGESPPVSVELFTDVQSHTDHPIQQKGQELAQKPQQEQSSDHVPVLTEFPSSTAHAHPEIGSFSFGTTESREVTPFIAINSLEGRTYSGPGPKNGFIHLPVPQTPEREPDRSRIKMYIIIGVIIFAVILLFILLFKYACLRGYFSKKKKKKRQMIQEELDRLMYSPSIFDEKNMYLPYTQLENSYYENEYEN